MAGVEYESVLCVKPTVHVFRIPPRSSNRGYRAADWKLDQPDWSGRLRVVAKGRDLAIKLEDKNSGELFAKCPVEQYPGIAVEAVNDSSRYFVLRIMDDNGRSAFIGIGFEDRGDSFDLNVALQDHFKHLKQEKDAEKAVEELEKGPKLDLGFKEGQTIRINISTKKNNEENGAAKKARPRGAAGVGGLGLLPPPPGGVKLPPPGGAGFSIGSSDSQFKATTQPSPVSNPPPQATSANSGGASNVELLLDLDMPSSTSSSDQGQGQLSAQSQGQSSNFGIDGFDFISGTGGKSEASTAQPAMGPSDPWGDFASASGSSNNSNKSSTQDTSWVQF